MSERISRSEQKRRYKKVEELAKELVGLSNSNLKNLPTTDEVKEEIKAIKGLKTGAKKRQIKYIAKILRHDSLNELFDYLEEKKGSKLKINKLLQEAERLRDVLISEAMADKEKCRVEQTIWDIEWPSEIIPDIIEKYTFIQEAEVRKLIYQYIKTYNKSHYRELYRMIRSAMEKHELVSKVAANE